MLSPLKFTLRSFRVLGVALCALFCVHASHAQTSQSPATTERQRNDEGPRAAQAQERADADLSITARVTARELRFEKVPNPQVEFTGKPERETLWDAVRENLPQQVQPGVTYRNIGVTLRITSVFADIERIVAEALGEISFEENSQSSPEASVEAVSSPAADTPTQVSPAAAAPSQARSTRAQRNAVRRGTRR